MSRCIQRTIFFGVIWGLPILCLALWARGWWFSDSVSWHSPRWQVQVYNFSGVVHVQWVDKTAPTYRNITRFTGPTRPAGWSIDSRRFNPADRTLRWKPQRGTGIVMEFIAIPWWLITLVALLPAMFISFPGRRKRRRRKLGLCINCGYDLQGQSDTSGVCPECGHPRR